MMIDNVNEKQDVVPDESKDTQEQSNTDSTAMEQVCVYFSLCCSSFSCGSLIN
jgi:hypothetical protein